MGELENWRVRDWRLSKYKVDRETSKQEKTAKGGIHANQLQAAWNEDYLLKVLPQKFRCDCPEWYLRSYSECDNFLNREVAWHGSLAE